MLPAGSQVEGEFQAEICLMAQVILLLTAITKMFMEYYCLPETSQTLEVFIPHP